MIAIFTRPTVWHKFILLSLSLVVISWTISNTFGFGEYVLHNSALDLQIFFLAIWLLSFSDMIPQRTLAALAGLSILLGLGFALFGEPIYYGGPNNLRPQPLTGGIIRVFPTAYFLAANVIIIDLLRRRGVIKARYALPILAAGILAVALYQVRTSWLILTCYFLGIAVTDFQWLRKISLFLVAFVFFAIAVFFGLTDYEAITGSSVESWGSGRIAAFIDRTEHLLYRDFGPFLFGTGPGSDALSTGFWGIRSSHSDVLSTLTERGIIGLIGLFAIVYALFGRVYGTHGRTVLLAMIVASLISNGFFSGNSMAFYYLVAMATAMGIPLAEPERREVG